MDTNPRSAMISAIHAAGARMVIGVTGGGSRAIADLLGVSGASRSVLAAVVPYCQPALDTWLGGMPETYCSARTARLMAMTAYQQARRYDPNATVAGLGCTASLATDRPKRGAHRAHLAWQSATSTASLSVELEKGRRGRSDEEAVVSDLLLNLAAEAAGVAARLPAALAATESLMVERVDAPPQWQGVVAGDERAVSADAVSAATLPLAVFPGAFNPCHQGHRQMAEIARQILGHQVAIELSIENVDKPPLDFIEIQQRVRQFADGTPVWLTRAARFTEKARLFPGATFIVGSDTIERIADLRYYRDEVALAEAVAAIAARGCRFLVFQRAREGRSGALAELALPEALAALCQVVPASTFHDSVSSTALRKQALQQQAE